VQLSSVVQTHLVFVLVPMFALTTCSGGNNESTASAFSKAEPLGSRLVWSAICVGVVLRLWQYLLNRSLWLDEALLGLDVIHRTYSGLLKPLDDKQGAPLGFVLFERFFVQHWGSSEYVLRLVPLLAGIVSLFLFYAVAKRVVRPAAVPIALGLFAIAPPLIYYSSELKQYSSDVAVALLLYLIALAPSPTTWGGPRISALGFIGAATIWCSHPAVFILASIGTVFGVILVTERQWKQLSRFGIAYALVIGSLIADYLVSLRNLAHDEYLLDYWAKNFMPLRLKSVSDLKWFYDAFFEFLRNPVGLAFSGLGALALIVGGFHLYARDRVKFWLLLLPWMFALLASALRTYPFGGRLMLFLVPSAMLLMGEGAGQIRAATRRDTPVAGYALIGLLFVDPAVYLLHHFTRPNVLVSTPGIQRQEEIRPVLAYVRSHQGPTDLVYVFRDARPAYAFYRERDHFDDSNVLLGTAAGENSREYTADLDHLRGRRVWVVFSHINGVEADAPKYACFYLDTMGKRLDAFSSAGAVAYLYDLTVQ
jgi:hypothetical protein